MNNMELKDELIKMNTTDAALKLVLNSTYGLMGSQYSKLYSAEVLLHVTLTGQLTMLMLIERLSAIKNVKVYASNTDSVVYKAKGKKAQKKAYDVVRQLEKESGLVFEDEHPKAQYMRDINSYIAVYDGYTKRKGFFAEPGLQKNPEHPIVQDAIAEYLLNGTPIAKMIKECTDMSKFCISRQVTGGALWSPKTYPNTEEYDNFIVEFEAGKRKDNKALRKRNDDYQKQFILDEGVKWYVGKVVRYYYSTEGKPMYYAKSGNKVPKSEGCKPMLELSKKVPKDIDYDKYIELANKYLKEIKNV